MTAVECKGPHSMRCRVVTSMRSTFTPSTCKMRSSSEIPQFLYPCWSCLTQCLSRRPCTLFTRCGGEDVTTSPTNPHSNVFKAGWTGEMKKAPLSLADFDLGSPWPWSSASGWSPLPFACCRSCGHEAKNAPCAFHSCGGRGTGRRR